MVEELTSKLELQIIEREVKSNSNVPLAAALAFLSAGPRRLKSIPQTLDPTRRANCLIDIAHQSFHKKGPSVFDALEPAAMAAVLANAAVAG